MEAEPTWKSCHDEYVGRLEFYDSEMGGMKELVRGLDFVGDKKK